MIFRIKPAAALVAAALWLAAGALPAVAETQVSVKDYAFAPAALDIKAGETVTWTNGDDSPHQLVAVDKSFRSPALDTGDRYSRTFATPGTYTYFCTLHPHMVGTVTVH